MKSPVRSGASVVCVYANCGVDFSSLSPSETKLRRVSFRCKHHRGDKITNYGVERLLLLPSPAPSQPLYISLLRFRPHTPPPHLRNPSCPLHPWPYIMRACACAQGHGWRNFNSNFNQNRRHLMQLRREGKDAGKAAG